MAFLFFWQGLHTFAHLLHTLQKSHVIFALLAHRVFCCTKKRILREKYPRQFAAFFCVHLPDGFKDHFTRDFCCRRHFVFHGLRSCSCCVLPVEVGFDLLRQLQPGPVLRVSVGFHQDGSSCMTRVALHRFEVAARLQQLVGGTGMPQTVKDDAGELRVCMNALMGQIGRLFQADERRTDDPAAGVQQILHVEAPHKGRDAGQAQTLIICLSPDREKRCCGRKENVHHWFLCKPALGGQRPSTATPIRASFCRRTGACRNLSQHLFRVSRNQGVTH